MVEPARVHEMDQAIAQINTQLDGLVEEMTAAIDQYGYERALAALQRRFRQADPSGGPALSGLAAAAVARLAHRT